MKLLVIPTLFPASEDDIKGIFILDYIKSVSDLCDVSVLDIRTDASNRNRRKEVFKGIPTHRFNIKKEKIKVLTYLKFFLSFRAIAKEISNEDFDVIHIHGSVFQASFGRWLAHKRAIPYFVTEHTGPFSKISGNPIFKSLSKRVIENAKALFTVSDDLYQQILASGIKPKRQLTTYNPVDTNLFNLDSSVARQKAFIFVGRLENYKGALRVLKAFHLNNIAFPDWKLNIIGDGPEMPDLENYTKDNGLEKSVFLFGKMSKAQIAEEFKKASIFVYPSEHETFGLVIAEAMSAGLPVIVGNETAPPEFVDSTQGLTVPPNNIESIGVAMSEVHASLNKYSDKEIRRKVIDQFSFKAFGKVLMENYKD